MKRLRALVGGVVAVVALGCAPAALAGPVTHSGLVSATPVAWSPQVLDGRVQAITRVGNMIVVGGSFSMVKSPGGTIVYRTNLFAFNATTGAISTTFAPSIQGGSVFALVPGPAGDVYAAGRFVTVNGKQLRGLVKLRLSDGLADATFRPRVGEGGVEDAKMYGARVYLSGGFARVGDAPRTGFAAVDPTTGAVDPDVAPVFAAPGGGPVEVTHFDVSPNGARVVAAGTFTTVDGLPRAQIAQLDLITHPVSVAAWSTNRFAADCKESDDGDIRDLAFSPDSKYFVVGTTGGGVGLCDAVSRFETYTPPTPQVETWWDPAGGDSITQIAISGAVIYAGGHQRWMENLNNNSQGAGAVPRSGVAALDPVNGMPFSWNPGRDPRGTGVYAFLVTPDGLWMGSDTEFTAGVYRPRLALFPLAGGAVIPPPTVASVPGPLDTIGTDGVWASAFDGTVVGRAFQLPTMASYVHVRGSFMIGRTLYSFWDDGHLYARTFVGGASDFPVDLPLYGMTKDIAQVSGAFYDPPTGRLYYTLTGDSNLYTRYFEPQSGLLGPVITTAARFADQPVTMTRAGDRIVYVAPGGRLFSLGFAARQADRGARASVGPARRRPRLEGRGDEPLHGAAAGVI